jgi:hypothetical protein
MRDNSGIDNLTKVNTQTSFQPKYQELINMLRIRRFS